MPSEGWGVEASLLPKCSETGAVQNPGNLDVRTDSPRNGICVFPRVLPGQGNIEVPFHIVKGPGDFEKILHT